MHNLYYVRLQEFLKEQLCLFPCYVLHKPGITHEVRMQPDDGLGATKAPLDVLHVYPVPLAGHPRAEEEHNVIPEPRGKPRAFRQTTLRHGGIILG